MKYLHINFIVAIGLFIGIIYGGFVWYEDFGELNWRYWIWALGIMPLLILMNIVMWVSRKE